jgi:hypothetical protein
MAPALAQNQQRDTTASRLPNPEINPTGQTVAPGGGGEAPVAVWLGRAQSDNAARTTGRGRGAYNAFGTAFNLVRDRGRIDASLVGNIEYRGYENDIAEDERVGNIAATAEIALVPERFSWLFGESYVQGRSDPFGADTVENRENVSVFATGPDVNLALGDRTSFGFSGTYSERTYASSTFLDSEMLATEIGLYRQATPTTVIGIAGEVTEVEYQSTTPGYDIKATYLSYERSLASGNVEVNLGSNELVTTQSTVREPYFELNWARALTGRSTLTLTATSGFTDSGRLLELRPDQLAIDVLLTTDATNRQQVGLEYELSLDRTSVVFGSTVLTDEFEQNTALDSDGREFHLEIVRMLTRLTTLGAGLLRVTRDFSTTGRDNEESFARLWVNRRLGANFALEAHVQRSENPGVYTERLYQVTLICTLGGSGARPERVRAGAAGGQN